MPTKPQPPIRTTSTPKITAHHSDHINHSSDDVMRNPLFLARGARVSPLGRDLCKTLVRGVFGLIILQMSPFVLRTFPP